MKITLNGKDEMLNKELSLCDFLQSKKIESSYMAIAINCEFVPKSKYDQTLIHNGDDIEIVTPHPGG